MCAGGEPGKCSSAGDGGGGLFSKLSDGRWQVVGIAAVVEIVLNCGIVDCGLYCGNGLPDVYTRVSQYIEWIELTISKMS